MFVSPNSSIRVTPPEPLYFLLLLGALLCFWSQENVACTSSSSPLSSPVTDPSFVLWAWTDLEPMGSSSLCRCGCWPCQKDDATLTPFCAHLKRPCGREGPGRPCPLAVLVLGGFPSLGALRRVGHRWSQPGDSVKWFTAGLRDFKAKWVPEESISCK